MHPHDTDPAEEWRPIPGFDGWYSVSSHGRIRRDRPFKNGHRGRILRPHPSGGYLRVTLSRDDVHTYTPVHRAVAEAFIGPRPPGCEINHIDGRRFNNTSANLEYVTRAQNRAHSARLGLDPSGERHWKRRHPERVQRGEQVPWAVLTEAQARDILSSYAPPEVTIPSLARQYGVSHTTVWRILHGLSWPHLEDGARQVTPSQ